MQGGPQSVRRALGITGVIALSIGAANLLGAHALGARQRWPAEESYVTLPPPEAAPYAYLGYRELAADVTWARLLVYYGAGFMGEGDFRYLGKFVDNIIALDPKFKKVYQWAIYSTMVTPDHRVTHRTEDVERSISLAVRATEAFPDDYEFYWVAGVRYFHDLKSDDPKIQRRYREKGSAYLEEAISKPNAPKDLAIKAASFRTALGQMEQARATLMQMVMTTDDPKAQEKMIASFSSVATSEVAAELRRAAQDFVALKAQSLPQVSSPLFVLLGGPAPSPVIEFDDLATDRDLLGTDEPSPEELLFP